MGRRVAWVRKDDKIESVFWGSLCPKLIAVHIEGEEGEPAAQEIVGERELSVRTFDEQAIAAGRPEVRHAAYEPPSIALRRSACTARSPSQIA